MIPIVNVGLRLLDEFYLFFWVVDECAEFATLRFTDVALEQFAHLAAYITRSILEHVFESCTLSVQVSQKVLGTLGQVEDGFQIDDFC